MTPVKLVEIAGTPAEKPEASDVKITSAEAVRIQAQELTGEFVTSRLHFSTAKPDRHLRLRQFEFTCPAEGTMKLEALVDDDNQNYKVYMKDGYMPQDNNHSAPLPLQMERKRPIHFFLDFTAPNFTAVKITQIEKNTAGEL